MTHANLVATELYNTGFETSIFNDNAVVVTLKNRKPSSIEITKALQELFDGIHFTVRSITDAILVTF